MMIFVYDLDGTICFKGKPLSDPMVRVLDSVKENGHEIVFASARPIRDLLPVLPAHMRHAPMVGGNGAFIKADGLNISTVHFEQPIAEEIIRLIKTYEADYLIDSAWDYAFSGNNDHPIRRNVDPEQRARNIRLEELNEIVKVVILRSLNAQLMAEELGNLPVVTYMHGTEAIIDISPVGVDKWTGLKALGIKPYEYIAFGNDANDVPMFRHAKRSICVGTHSDLMQLTLESVKSDEEQVIHKILEVVEELDKDNVSASISV
ncbi:Cof-type HAD-IIB family hydrolase [Paenibacillus spongiae]|uniref:Cof-type HAD-IIB family hydrolase n=1 Tax=Paenibacillus spongiae TaxID=2909671 RepID=A0ABY5S2G1_9BACL|nr:Cof-type HAD-IIB family hydrolase [Paenibacillus spongiae]UVI28076.1 Cof-type HAD-IIB family hydrolase [Paenibacillus spongiae]